MDWAILLTTFGLVFIAELGDKTQLAVLAQICKHRRPWAVFAGASLALIAVTALGAVGGRLVSRVIPPSALRWAAAAAFALLGALVARQAARAGGEDDECTSPADGDGEASAAAVSGDWRAFGATFGLLFVAEMGDKTQLAVLSLAGNSRVPWAVFLGGGLALTAVTALAVVAGEGLCRLVPRRALLWVSAVTFVVMGVLLALGAS